MSDETPSNGRRIRYYWEDFPPGSVREFGGMAVEREAVLAFASAFDPQPFHLDDAAADAYLMEAASPGSPGIDSLRWLKPVFPGDTLHVRMTVLQARPMNSRPTVGLVQSSWEVMNQHGDAVLAMEGWGMFRRRPAEENTAV
jgi:acyl dehydratase